MAMTEADGKLVPAQEVVSKKPDWPAKRTRGLMKPWGPDRPPPGIGRPVGARSKLVTKFVDDLYAHWQKHGVKALNACAEKKPDVYVRVVADLVPKHVHIQDDTAVAFLEALQHMNERARAGPLIDAAPNSNPK